MVTLLLYHPKLKEIRPCRNRRMLCKNTKLNFCWGLFAWQTSQIDQLWCCYPFYPTQLRVKWSLFCCSVVNSKRSAPVKMTKCCLKMQSWIFDRAYSPAKQIYFTNFGVILPSTQPKWGVNGHSFVVPPQTRGDQALSKQENAVQKYQAEFSLGAFHLTNESNRPTLTLFPLLPNPNEG